MNQQTQIDILFSVIANLQEQVQDLKSKLEMKESFNTMLVNQIDELKNNSEPAQIKHFSTKEYLQKQF